MPQADKVEALALRLKALRPSMRESSSSPSDDQVRHALAPSDFVMDGADAEGSASKLSNHHQGPAGQLTGSRSSSSEPSVRKLQGQQLSARVDLSLGDLGTGIISQ